MTLLTVLTVALTVAVAALAVLVAGLLRSHASILRRLHELDGGNGLQAVDGPTGRVADVPYRGVAAPFRTVDGIPGPAAPAGAATAAQEDRRSPDISGRTLSDDAVVIRTSGSAADTILLFLSSGCATCQTFWTELADPVGLRIPPGGRLLVVTKGADQESLSAVAELAPQAVDLVMSSQAWVDYRVPGSPYVVAVDGPTGRVKGEGTGMSWEQVSRLLAQATGDLSYLPGTERRVRKPQADADREARVDRELLAAGILPGDASLYQPPVAAAAQAVDGGRS